MARAAKAKAPVELAGDANDNRIVIRKYPNRRLYNTATSSYIVLKDVVELVRDGKEFVIQDAKTGEDITRGILNQIIFEQEGRSEQHHFPLEFQKQLISMYGDAYGAMVPNYLTESLKLLATERAKMAEAVGTAAARNTKAIVDYTQNLAQQNMEMVRRSWDMFGRLATPSKSGKSEENGASAALSREEELADIQNRIDALQKRLEELK